MTKMENVNTKLFCDCSTISIFYVFIIFDKRVYLSGVTCFRIEGREIFVLFKYVMASVIRTMISKRIVEFYLFIYIKKLAID